MPSTGSNILFEQDFGKLAALIEGRRAFAVVDSGFKHPATESIFKGNVLYYDAGEGAKTLQSVETLATGLLKAGADRDSLIVGIGGGITTDTAGFLASVYMRGTAFGAVPTTMLAQVDAAIGGKNGVNLQGYKNILGTFAQSEFIFICPPLFESESPLSRRCGMVEMLKTFIISNRNSYFEAVERFKTGNGTPVEELVKRAALTKLAITQRDPFDRGERQLLNLGHTFAHAIEKCSGGKIPHGEAVAQGILIAARISVTLGRGDKQDLASLERDFKELDLLPSTGGISVCDMLEAVKMDKKRSGGEIALILPLSIGEAVRHKLSVKQMEELLRYDML